MVADCSFTLRAGLDQISGTHAALVAELNEVDLADEARAIVARASFVMSSWRHGPSGVV